MNGFMGKYKLDFSNFVFSIWSEVSDCRPVTLQHCSCYDEERRSETAACDDRVGIVTTMAVLDWGFE